MVAWFHRAEFFKIFGSSHKGGASGARISPAALRSVQRPRVVSRKEDVAVSHPCPLFKGSGLPESALEFRGARGEGKAEKIRKGKQGREAAQA